MSSLIDKLRDRIESPEKRKFIKYSFVSVISVFVTEVVLLFCYVVLGYRGGWSGFIASTVASVPSYFLNRNWVWGKSGKSHMMKEVLPFWIMVLIGIGFSTFVSHVAEDFAKGVTESQAAQGMILVIANVVSFGFLWILKFIIFNKILFAHREDQLDPAFDGRSGLPT